MNSDQRISEEEINARIEVREREKTKEPKMEIKSAALLRDSDKIHYVNPLTARKNLAIDPSNQRSILDMIALIGSGLLRSDEGQKMSTFAECGVVTWNAKTWFPSWSYF